MACIFCSIADNSIASEVIGEDADVKVFKDIHPKAPVHLLVIPKMHVRSIAHLQADHDSMIAKLIYAAKEAAEKMALKGYKLIFNVGKDGGQVVDHLHLHLLGGWASSENPDQFRV